MMEDSGMEKTVLKKKSLLCVSVTVWSRTLYLVIYVEIIDRQRDTIDQFTPSVSVG